MLTLFQTHTHLNSSAYVHGKNKAFSVLQWFIKDLNLSVNWLSECFWGIQRNNFFTVCLNLLEAWNLDNVSIKANKSMFYIYISLSRHHQVWCQLVPRLLLCRVSKFIWLIKRRGGLKVLLMGEQHCGDWHWRYYLVATAYNFSGNTLKVSILNALVLYNRFT